MIFQFKDDREVETLVKECSVSFDNNLRNKPSQKIDGLISSFKNIFKQKFDKMSKSEKLTQVDGDVLCFYLFYSLNKTIFSSKLLDYINLLNVGSMSELNELLNVVRIDEINRQEELKDSTFVSNPKYEAINFILQRLIKKFITSNLPKYSDGLINCIETDRESLLRKNAINDEVRKALGREEMMSDKIVNILKFFKIIKIEHNKILTFVENLKQLWEDLQDSPELENYIKNQFCMVKI